jgi:hypothetical protein
VSKRSKGKTCVYCDKIGTSTTKDHIIAKEFLPINERDNIPQAPSCVKCNNDKSKLEHYAASILPFGSQTYYAKDMLKNAVPRRLVKNAKLQREIKNLSKLVWTNSDGGILLRTLSLPLNARPIANLLKYTVRGLYYYHWKTVLPQDHGVYIRSFSAKGLLEFRHIFSSINSENHITNSIGNGGFVYRCTRNNDDKGISAWEMSFYNGEMMFGKGPDGKPQQVYYCGFTGPEENILATT